MKLALPFIPWILLIIMTGLYIGKRDDLTRAIEQCNTDKMESVADARQVTLETARNAFEARLADLEALSRDAETARDIAIQARIEAESRPPQVRTVIQRVKDEDSCIDTAIHPDLLGCLRSNEDCGEAGPG